MLLHVAIAVGAMLCLACNAQTTCVDGTPFLLQISANGAETACRPCDPSLNVNSVRSYCSCPVQQYCTSYGADNSVRSQYYGTCKPYSILNKPCSQWSDCLTHTTDYNGATVIDEALFCVNGACVEYDPSMWTQLTGGVAAYTCLGLAVGYTGDFTSHPGETRQCLSNGTLVSGGTLDYSYGATASTTATGTPTRSRNANQTPSSSPTLTSSATASLSMGASPSVSPSVGADSATTSDAHTFAVATWMLFAAGVATAMAFH